MKSSEFCLLLSAILLAPHIPVMSGVIVGCFYLIAGAGITFLEFMVEREKKDTK